jgi:hypothetical protein
MTAIATRILRPLALAAVGAAALLAAGCTTPPETPDLSVPRYEDRPPIRLDVADIRVVQSYNPPLKKPNVEHMAPVSPADAARQWARDRLRAVGTQGTATLDIVNAAVTEHGVETESGLSGFLTTEPEAEYTARLALVLRVERAMDSGQVRVRGSRGTGILEGASIHEREKTLHGLVVKLMDDIDAQVDETLAESFGKYVMPPDA